jgi:hypothetical protein
VLERQGARQGPLADIADALRILDLDLHVATP